MNDFFKKPGQNWPGFFLSKKNLKLLLALALLLSCTFWCFERKKNIAFNDPDHYYHLAISRMTAQTGLVRSLPQVEDLGWGDYFPDKEFLFHQLTTIAYKIGGENAVEKIPILLATTLVVSIFLILNFFTSTGAALLSLLPLFCTPHFFVRILLLRPHLLAMNILIWMIFAMLSGRCRLAAICAFLFSLAYHAFYVPLALLGIFYFAFADRKKTVPVLVWTLIGLVVGILVNPYFPSTILMGVRHLMIAAGETTSTNLNFGMELIPVRSDELVKVYAFHFLLLMTCLFTVFNQRRSSSDQQRFAFSTFAYGTFLGLMTFSPRATEYALPLCSFALAFLLHTRKKMRIPLAPLVLVALGVLQFNSVKSFYTAIPEKPERIVDTLKALSLLPEKPETGSPSKVFNCEWDQTPYLLYTRPNYRFIDILDPSFLVEANKSSFKSRSLLLSGLAPDAYGLIREVFKSKYVICRTGAAIAQFESDPDFQRIYPDQETQRSNPPLYIYRLAENRTQNIVVDFEFAKIPELKSLENHKLDERYLSLSPKQTTLWERVPTPSEAKNLPPSYIDFFKLLNLKAKESAASEFANDTLCAAIRPTAAEIQRLQGRDYLGIGGGRNIRIWLNGAPLYSSIEPRAVPRTINHLLKLPHSLKITDRIEAIVCSTLNSEYMGFSLSFWTGAENRKNLCVEELEGERAMERRTELGILREPEQKLPGPRTLKITRNQCATK